MKFEGSLVALITPFLDDAVDERRLAALVDWQIEQGSSGIVVLGSTGEGSTLSDAEKETIVGIAARTANGRVPVIAGATSSSTRVAAANARAAAKAGADALLVASPYYNRPTPEGMFRHFEDVCAATELPVILYNIPSRTAVNMPLDLILRLARLPTVVAIKESSGDLELASDIIAGAPDGFVLIAGEDSLTLPLLALGAAGVISVSANVAPARSAALVAAFLAGDVAAARELHYQLLPLWRALFVETNPGPLKAAAQMLGLCADEVRLPLVAASESTRRCLTAALTDFEPPLASG